MLQVLRWRIARTYNSDALLKSAFPSIPGSVISAASIEQLRAAHQMAVAGEKVDIVRRLSTMAAQPSAPVKVPTLHFGGARVRAGTGDSGGGVGASAAAAAAEVAVAQSASPVSSSDLPGGLSEEEEEAHAEAERALSENGSPREALRVASLGVLLSRPQVVLQSARSI